MGDRQAWAHPPPVPFPPHPELSYWPPVHHEEVSFAGIDGLIGCVGIPFDTPRLPMPVAGRVMSPLKGGACPGNGGRLLTDVPGSLKFGGGSGGGMLVLRPFAFAGGVLS